MLAHRSVLHVACPAAVTREKVITLKDVTVVEGDGTEAMDVS